MTLKLTFALTLLFAASSALAGPAKSIHVPAAKNLHPAVTVTPLVSDQKGVAPNLDPNLVNSWGLAQSDTGPLWGQT